MLKLLSKPKAFLAVVTLTSALAFVGCQMDVGTNPVDALNDNITEAKITKYGTQTVMNVKDVKGPKTITSSTFKTNAEGKTHTNLNLRLECMGTNPVNLDLLIVDANSNKTIYNSSLTGNKCVGKGTKQGTRFDAGLEPNWIPKNGKIKAIIKINDAAVKITSAEWKFSHYSGNR